MRARLAVLAALLVAIAASTACSTENRSATQPTRTPGVPSATTPAVTVFAVGDIASCGNDNDAATAALVAQSSAPILLLGDEVYDKGSTQEFAQCYDPPWGALKDRSYPVAGNHEYNTPGAKPYFEYFGVRAGTPGEGWYSFDLGGWHLIALNSNCDDVGGCQADSPQGKWLAADLAANRAPCTLAFWHHPRFSSGPHGSTTAMEPFWQMLSDAGADLVLSGHDHHYERFAPKDRDGRNTPAGLRQFVVGTGGKSLYPTVIQRSGSEATNASAYGVLELALKPTDYEWKFAPVAGATYSDSGAGSCSA